MLSATSLSGKRAVSFPAPKAVRHKDNTLKRSTFSAWYAGSDTVVMPPLPTPLSRGERGFSGSKSRFRSVLFDYGSLSPGGRETERGGGKATSRSCGAQQSPFRWGKLQKLFSKTESEEPILEPLPRRTLRFRELLLWLFVFERTLAGVGLARAFLWPARD